MDISCKQRCDFVRILADLICPNCIEVKANLNEKDRCDCRLTIDPERMWQWE